MFFFENIFITISGGDDGVICFCGRKNVCDQRHICIPQLCGIQRVLFHGSAKAYAGGDNCAEHGEGNRVSGRVHHGDGGVYDYAGGGDDGSDYDGDYDDGYECVCVYDSLYIKRRK